MRILVTSWRVSLSAVVALGIVLLGAQLPTMAGRPHAEAASVHTLHHGRPAAGGRVLILSTTITQPSGPGSSLEEQAALAAGETPVVVGPTLWDRMSAAQFAGYDAIVLGDPTCGSSASALDAAVANATVWGPIVNGNVVILGTDPVYHAPSQVGAQMLIKNGIAFAAQGGVGTTGAYLDLSCYYNATAAHTNVPLLDDAFAPGTTAFQVLGPSANSVHVVSSNAVVAGETDSSLSNWSISVHEAFDAYPSSFTPLAIAVDGGTTYCVPDGTCGDPYLLARGPGVLSPAFSFNPNTGVYEQPLILSGSHFGPNETVYVYANSTSTTPIYVVTTAADGSFSQYVRTREGPYGSHVVIAVGQASGLRAITTFFLKPSLVLVPNSGAPGTVIGVTGYCFGASESVVLHWNSPSGQVLGSVTSASYGRFSTTITVPLSKIGSKHLIWGVGQSSGAAAYSLFTVT